MDFNKVFTPIVRHSSIRVLLAMVALYDLELEQLDVKTTFLRGELRKLFICINQRGSLLKVKNAKTTFLHEEVVVWFKTISKTVVQTL
jgi:hypothetical protein